MTSVSCQKPLCMSVGKRMIVTGPDYIKDHVSKVHEHTSYIGEKRPTLEKTGDLRYLWREAPHRSLPPKYKHEYVGEVGWGVQYTFINTSRLQSGFHRKHGELSLAAIDKISHRYQNPWQPKPSVLDTQGRYSRGFLAWHMDDYENTLQRNSRRALLLKQSKLPSLRVPHPSKVPKTTEKKKKRPCAINPICL
ncbi:protein SPMIP2 [Thomomys bottae]